MWRIGYSVRNESGSSAKILLGVIRAGDDEAQCGSVAERGQQWVHLERLMRKNYEASGRGPGVTLGSGGALTVFQEEELVRGGGDGYTFGKH